MARRKQELEAAIQAVADQNFETTKVDQALGELIKNVFVKGFIKGAIWADKNPVA